MFIHNYNGAMMILSSIGTGKCSGNCKTSWMSLIKHALKSKTNRLNLTSKQRKSLTEKVKTLSGRNAVNAHASTLKKYKTRKSPPYPANKNCNRTMKGNDGRMYISKANKNGACSWKKIT